VYAGTRIVRVRCPPGAGPGTAVQITVPGEDVVTRQSNVAVLTTVEGEGRGGAQPMNDQTRMLNASILTSPQDEYASLSSSALQTGSSSLTTLERSYDVVVPRGIRPGDTFPIEINSQSLRVQCPPNARPGMTVRIVLPPGISQPSPTPTPPSNMQHATDLNSPPEESPSHTIEQRRMRTIDQVFEVTVPRGVRPNQPFSLMAGSQRVLVTCPANARAGTRIRFHLPVSIPDDGESDNKMEEEEKNVQNVSLKYSTKDGWVRTFRLTDKKFTWCRIGHNGDIMSTQDDKFDIESTAFVRELIFLRGNDERMRTGKLALVPASKSSVDSCILDERVGNKQIVGYAEIAMVQEQSLDDKVAWLLKTCKSMSVPWEQGHMRICVRRQALLHDSIKAVMSLGREEMRKIWRFEFMGEQGIDAGGLAKEWFQLVTEAIFDADSGLWSFSANNQMLMRINPASEVSCPEDHLIYFRFLGRVLGKALFEGYIVGGHMVQYLYKYILGWPLTFEDMESVDSEIYENLKKLLDMNPQDIELLCLDFTATQNLLGETVTIDLVPNGSDKTVTAENLLEYLESYMKYFLLERIKPQVTELLLGFYDVIPESALTVFDYQELELMLCGLPNIDVDDWIEHTIYKNCTRKTQVVQWFWKIVREFDQETKARLLQFATGTSGVPSRGFSVLQGSDGNIKLFTINMVDLASGSYPKAQ
jgi:E3 ubiquitin-protein ligase NEDD4